MNIRLNPFNLPIAQAEKRCVAPFSWLVRQDGQICAGCLQVRSVRQRSNALAAHELAGGHLVERSPTGPTMLHVAPITAETVPRTVSTSGELRFVN